MDDNGGPGPPPVQRKSRGRISRPATDRSRSSSSTSSKRTRGKDFGGTDKSNIIPLAISTEKTSDKVDNTNLKILADSAVAIANKISIDYKYNEEHHGPFIVYVDAVDPSGARKPINAITLNRLLHTLQIDGITELTKIGYGRCKVTFKNANMANKFVYDSKIKENGYNAKIFAHFVSKIGLVFDIPGDLSMDEFQLSINSPVPILKCIRIERKDPEDNEKKIPTGRVKIIFDGLEIPREICYGYTKIKVKHYISFAQCYRCFRFNHFAQQCRQQIEICKSCFNKHEQNDPCGQMMCTNCKNNHHPTSKSCPARTKAYTIKKIMTLENLSVSEARTKYSGIFGNRFAVLDDNENYFPALPPHTKPNTNLYNNNKEAAISMHNLMPFSKVVRRNVNREREAEKSKQNMEQWRNLTQHNNDMNNEPNRNFVNPHKSSDVERVISQFNVNRISTDNTSQINQPQGNAEETLININSSLDNFLSQWVNYNLTFDQKEFLRGLQSQIMETIGSTVVTP